MRYASRDKPLLTEIAVINEEVIEDIASRVPPSGLTIGEVKSDTDIADALTKKHATGSDNQDLSGYEPANPNIQAHVISAHAPANAQPNNISDVNAGLLTGGQQTNLHSHPTVGGSDPWTVVKLGVDFVSSLATNANVTNFYFTPQANKTYLIFGYFLLRTATATVGARPGIAWPSGLTDGVMRAEASNSLTTSGIRLWGAKTTQNAASTGLATTVDSHWGSIDGIMITAANVSGNFQITLASETAGTNVTMKAGSILMYREL